jgi:hypothetical protein
VNAAGVPQWTADGVAVCTATAVQNSPTIVSDGAGGAIMTWYDYRNGTNLHIYAQRVNAAGVPQWAANGVAVCTAANQQQSPTIVSDGAGGAIVTWQDDRSTSTDIYAQRVNAAGVPQWTADGVALCTAADRQLSPTIVTDGAGGAIVTWEDQRVITNRQIYAQRVNAAGVPQWTANGVALCPAAGDQQLPTIVSDGAGGAIVTWEDGRSGHYDIYAQRMNAAGVPQWTADGVAVCTATGDQRIPTIVTDGAEGAIVTWQDARSGTSWDIYAQRVSAAGAPQWTANGVALCIAAGFQESPTIVSDGAEGAIVTWQDSRSRAGYDIYAQRVERFGQLGNPEPTIVSVRDVPNDQGGKVGIAWTASYLDVAPGNPLDAYWIWRQTPAAVAQAALRGGAQLYDVRAALGAPKPGTIRSSVQGTQIYYWEFVASQVAHGYPGYSYTAAMLSDSVAGSNPYTLFMVEAEETYAGLYWSSAPDSGYSVDNLPPVAPAPFSANFAAGVTHLHWGENREPDLAGYRLYRGSSAGFVPGPGNLLVAQPDTGYADAGPAGSYYRLSAVDIHGNESAFALLTPGSITAVGGGLPRELALALTSSNPARGGASLRYSLPQAGAVRLVVYDLAGREARVLASGRLEAGDYSARWDGRNETGQPVRGGMYLVRLEAGGRALVQRLALLP